MKLFSNSCSMHYRVMIMPLRKAVRGKEHPARQNVNPPDPQGHEEPVDLAIFAE